MLSLQPRPLARLLATGVVGGALACSGCGSSVAVTASGPRLAMTLSEYAITPQDVRIPAGRITLAVRNGGSIPHRLQVRSGTRVLATSRPLPPGQRTEVVVTLTPGAYTTTDPLDRHDTLGQHGTIHAH